MSALNSESKVRILFLGAPYQNPMRQMSFSGEPIFFIEEMVKTERGQLAALITGEIPFRQANVIITRNSTKYAFVHESRVKDRFFKDTGDTLESILPKLYDSANYEMENQKAAISAEASQIIQLAQAQAEEIIRKAEAKAEEILARIEQAAQEKSVGETKNEQAPEPFRPPKPEKRKKGPTPVNTENT